MADKKKKPDKSAGVAKMVKSFLKRGIKPLSKEVKAPVARKEPTARKPITNTSGSQTKVEIVLPKKPELKKTGVTRAVAKNGKEKHAGPASSSRGKPKSGPKYFFHTDVSDSYNETYMRAMPRDPEWLFVYWEISESTRKSLSGKMGNAAFETSKKLLRLCDVTDIDYNGSNAQRYIDIEININANNWYVHVPESGRAYIVECGFLTSDGKFYLAVRSNVVNVPHYGLSAVQDQEWTTAGTDELIGMSADGLKRGLGASEKRFGITVENSEIPENMFGIAAGSGSGMFGMPSSRA